MINSASIYDKFILSRLSLKPLDGPHFLESPGQSGRNHQVTTDTGYPHNGHADNAAYRHDCRADKRRYPHDREIDIQMLKMSRNGYILS